MIKNFSSDDRACLNYMYEIYNHVMAFDEVDTLFNKYYWVMNGD